MSQTVSELEITRIEGPDNLLRYRIDYGRDRVFTREVRPNWRELQVLSMTSAMRMALHDLLPSMSVTLNFSGLWDIHLSREDRALLDLKATRG